MMMMTTTKATKSFAKSETIDGNGDTVLKYNIDPDTYYVGYWTGIDPLDGTDMNREFVPVMMQDNNFTFTGRIEYSEICGAGPPPLDGAGGDIEEPPEPTELQIPARLNGFGSVDPTTNVMKVMASLTCFGSTEPRAPNIPVDYVPISKDIMMEVPAFRADFPIYMHRMSPYYEPLH
jgi:hypothetical protein